MQNDQLLTHCSSVYVLIHSCTCSFGYAERLSCSQYGLPQHLDLYVLYALQQCFNKSLFQMQTCTNIDCTLSSAVRRREDWGEQSEARLWKTSFQVISVSRVAPVGLRARRHRCCSHPLELIATPHSLLSKSLPFSAKSPVSLCLPPCSCPIAIHCFLRLHFWFTILCLCGAPSISLSPISITVDPSHSSFYLTVR